VLYHEGDFGSALDLDGNEPVSKSVAADFAFPPGARNEFFGLEYFGAITVPADGVYTFYTTSDDGSRLYIADKLVVPNDYPHGATEKKGTIGLRAGRHPIYVAYFQGAVDAVLQVLWEGPGIEKGPIPPEALTQHPKAVRFPADAVSTTELEWPDIGRKLTVTVDTRDAPELGDLRTTIPDVLRKHYPDMLSVLAVEGRPVPTKVGFSVRHGIDNPAFASGGRIVLSAEWFTSHPDDLGCFVHEMVHLIQRYPGSRGTPGWLVEGIADYVRYKVGADTRWHIPKSYREGSSYTNGYGVTAAFLVYIERTHDPDLVKKLNRALAEGTYKGDLFRDYTGKTVDELWADYKAWPGEGG
jgi:hypothetical protein